jgi:hypothetical protein
MTYITRVATEYADSPSIDAFGRARVSELTTLFDLKQIQGNSDIFVDKEVNGTGTYSYSTSGACMNLITSASSDYVVHQTKERFNYQSGKSQLVLMTFDEFGTQGNVTKEFGYYNAAGTGSFDSNKDGITFKNDGSNYYLKVYKNGTETHSIVRSSWDDPMDGTGRSGFDVDFDKSQIAAFDFEWLGVGRIRYYLVINGLYVQIHEINNANNSVGTYMRSPNHSLRWEMRQTGAGSGSFNYICGTVSSEGSQNQIGKVIGYDLGNTSVSMANTARKYVMLAMRLKQTNLDAVVDLLDLSFLSTSNDDIIYNVYLNPTINSGTLTFADVDNSSIQVADGTGQYMTAESGLKMKAGHFHSGTAIITTVDSALRLGAFIDDTADIIVITAQSFTANANVSPAINWRELL